MRALLASAALAAALLVSPAAFASESATGTITAVDMDAMTVTLDDGTVYTLPSDYEADTLQVGDMVEISWNMEDGKHMVESLSLAE